MLFKFDREKENCDRYGNMNFDIDPNKSHYQELREPRRKNNVSDNVAAHHRFPRKGYENTRVNRWRVGDATDYANVCPENTIQKNGNCISNSSSYAMAKKYSPSYAMAKKYSSSYAMAKKNSSSNKVNTLYKDSNKHIVEEAL